MKEPIKIAFAEDYAIEREGIVQLLSEYKDLKFVFLASNGKELLDWLEKHTPNVVLLDLNMHVMDGRETFAKIRSKYPKMKVIIFTEYFTDNYITEFMKKGARAFLSKNNRIEKVADTIRRVHMNGICVDPMVSNILTKIGLVTSPDTTIHERADLRLSAKEILILRYMCQGKESKEIASLTFNAIKTIEHHRSEIWKKASCKTLPDLMEFAFKHGLITF